MNTHYYVAKIIVDEYSNRKDLTPHQKWKFRHPEKAAKIKNNNARKVWKNLSPKERTEKHLWKRHKITFDDWQNMFEEQNHQCAICHTEIKPLLAENNLEKGVVDHCHKTGKIRGLLCHHCNRALGLLKEDINSIKTMLKYLGVNNDYSSCNS